ncbi:MAG: peptidyl-alpha-hydroxyglycine alpha-amidating lyase family protein [Ferruginibacter sp.]
MKLFAPLAAILLFACSNAAVNQGGLPAVRYELVKDWPQLPASYKLGQVAGIGIDTSGNIVLFHRAGREWGLLDNKFPATPIEENTILTLDRKNGSIINNWGAGLFIMPHGLLVDKMNNVWVTDVGRQQVLKFNAEGKLLRALGEEKVAGNDSLHFNMPTDIAVATDGSFYVSDGYGNSRILKFSANGNYIFEWGSRGTGPGQFNIPHAIDLGTNGNVYVADRENNRIQEFSAEGKFIKEWRDGAPEKLYAVTVDKQTGHVFAADYAALFGVIAKGSNIIEFDSSGWMVQEFGRSGNYEGPKCRYHDIAVDKEGNIYAADILGNRVQKFKRINN